MMTTRGFDRQNGRCYPEPTNSAVQAFTKDSLMSRQRRDTRPPPPLSQRAILPQAYRNSPPTPPGSSDSSGSGSSTYVNFHIEKRHTPPSPSPPTSHAAASSQSSDSRRCEPTATFKLPQKPRSDPGPFSPTSRWSPDSFDKEHDRGRSASAGVMRRLSNAANGLARRLSSGSSKSCSKRSSGGTKSSKSSDWGRSLPHSLRRHYRHYYHQDGRRRDGLQRRYIIRATDSTTAVADLNLDEEEHCRNSVDDSGGDGDSSDHCKTPSESFFNGLRERLVARMVLDHGKRRRQHDTKPPLSRSSRYAETSSRKSSPRQPSYVHKKVNMWLRSRGEYEIVGTGSF